jgi:hypothetical protein
MKNYFCLKESSKNLNVMKTRLLAFACVLMLTASNLMAQGKSDVTFKVLVNKGKSEVKAGPNWQAVKVGSTLKDTDELKVSENSYVGLVHVNGKPLEVKKAGKYKVVDLAQQVSGGTSVLNKYTDFILSSNEEKKNRLAATGAVHRGVDFPVFLPMPAQRAVIFQDQVIIDWEFKGENGPFVVTLSSMFGDELQKVETKDSNLKINLADPLLANEDNIVVRVEVKGSPNKKSEDHTLKRLSKADKERISTSYKDVSSQMDQSTALTKYFMAGFYEENGLLIDAATAYQEAIALEPMYKEDYNDFLLRTGLKPPPVK